MQHRIALMVLACGVAVFLAALYGPFGPASPVLAIGGIAGLVVGLAILAYSLWGSRLSRPHIATVVLVALGVALHGYEQTLSSVPFSVSWLLWALLPYVVCLVASALPATRVASVAGAFVVLLLGLWAHYLVFMNPKSSTAALALVFIPLWSTLVFAPVAMLIAWLVGRHVRLRGVKS